MGKLEEYRPDTSIGMVHPCDKCIRVLKDLKGQLSGNNNIKQSPVRVNFMFGFFGG